MIKLIIWDLDGVLWSESLSETESTGQVNYKVVDFIKKTEQQGIIHSICSKNKKELAEQELKKLDILDLFIFSVIEYSPKGPSVKQIIENCQLREENVLFVDDNQININEAKYFCPNLLTENNTDFIDNFIFSEGKSKTKDYKILEEKNKDKNNTNFLKDSNINITITNKNDCLLFYDRITELVNRSNQLNFSKTRFRVDQDHDLMQFANGIGDRENYVVFVWDKYGYYGLVGFFSNTYSKEKKLDRFVFSCRIMNMGIENYCLKYVKEVLKYEIPYDHIKHDGDYSYITYNDFSTVENFIHAQEKLLPTNEKVYAKIYAYCLTFQLWVSSPIYNLIGYEDFADLEKILPRLEKEPKIIVMSLLKYFIINNYKSECVIENYEYVTNLFKKFLDECNRLDKKVLFIIPEHMDNIEFLTANEQDLFKRLFEFFSSFNVEKLFTPRYIETQEFLEKQSNYARNRITHFNKLDAFELSQKMSKWIQTNIQLP